MNSSTLVMSITGKTESTTTGRDTASDSRPAPSTALNSTDVAA